MTIKKIYLYPKWVRLWHIINALMCLTLIFTGISMQYSSKETIMLNFWSSVRVHDIAGITLASNYLLFFFGNLFSSNRKHYMSASKGFIKRLMQQLNYYLFGMFKGKKPPFPITEEQKFNPVQQITYKTIMYFFVPMMIITGILMFYHSLIPYKIFNINGPLFVDIVHITGGFVITLFLLVHIYFSTIGHKINSHFKSIVNGYHEINHE
ncbi:MAG: cytochrome b/b6 domain-containing protein [Bacteroidota bacterium]